MRNFFLFAAPSLAAFWMAFAFVSANPSIGLDYGRILGYAAIFSAVVCGLLFIVGRLYRPAAHPGVALAAAAFMIASFQYDQVGVALLQVDIFSVKLQLGLWAFGAVAVAVAVGWLGRLPVGRMSVMIGLAAMLAAAVLQTGLNAAGGPSESSSAPVSVPNPTALEAAESEFSRSVISIVLDTYARSDVLASMFAVDNKSFERALEQRGFVVADQAMSNYPWTSLSMSSALDMNYTATDTENYQYDSAGLAYVANGLNETVSQFRGQGYTFALFHAGRYRTTIDCSGYEDVCLQCSGRFDEMELVLLEKTPLGHLLRKFAPSFYISLGGGDCPIDTLPDKMRRLEGGPFFLFGHHMALHDAMHVDEKCQTLDGPVPATWPSTQHAEEMRLQVACINRQTLAVIDHVLETHADPIILISGDHGFWSDGYSDLKPEALWRRHAIFTALRLPEMCRETVPVDLTPVNHYRLITACLTGQSPDLLPNRFFATQMLEPGNPRSPIRVHAINPQAPLQ